MDAVVVVDALGFSPRPCRCPVPTCAPNPDALPMPFLVLLERWLLVVVVLVLFFLDALVAARLKMLGLAGVVSKSTSRSGGAGWTMARSSFRVGADANASRASRGAEIRSALKREGNI